MQKHDVDSHREAVRFKIRKRVRPTYNTSPGRSAGVNMHVRSYRLARTGQSLTVTVCGQLQACLRISQTAAEGAARRARGGIDTAIKSVQDTRPQACLCNDDAGENRIRAGQQL